MKVKFVGLPSTSLKDEQDKLNEEGLFLTLSTILFTWEMQRCIITKDFTAAAYMQKL
jgi:hypothetical protein